MVYITGDTHGNFNRIKNFCVKNNTTKNDVLIILGDAGINYNLDSSDTYLKYQLSKLPITLFCIHGNHEERPENINTYKTDTFLDGEVYVESKFPHIFFAKDGQVYNINNHKCLVLGGAYSVDKDYRIACGAKWFASEQIPDDKKREIEHYLEQHDWNVDYVLSHTCPYNVRPTHLFLAGVDQSTVDNSMEVWLQKIADRLEFKHWYFGHYHADEDNEKYSMFYTDIVEFFYKEVK